jgi:outer membrane immunogenic protein
MRTQLLAATALTTTVGFLVPGFALAQSTFDWSGFYVGLSGGVINNQSLVNFDYGGTLSLPASVKVPGIGELGSTTVGYDWQNGQFVYGLAGDMGVVKLHGHTTGPVYTIDDSLNTLLSLRARFGVAFDRMLIFATAGVAGGNADFNADVGKGSASGKGFVTGTIVGVGTEYAVNDNVAITAAAKYYNLSTLTGTGDAGKGVADPYTATYKPAGLIFETGLNVRF